jgi:hypothetical protein
MKTWVYFKKLENLPKCKTDLASAVDYINTTIACSLVGVDELHEAGRYPFITPIINEVVKNLNGIKHHSQRPMREGDVARGDPDWVLVYEDSNIKCEDSNEKLSFPIFVIEGKVNIDKSAVAQIVLQMYEAYVKMRPKGYSKPWEMHGMLTTAVEVVFVKALFCGEQCVGVWRSEDVFRIPHYEGMKTKDYTDNAMPIIQHAVAMAKKQIEQIREAHKSQR